MYYANIREEELKNKVAQDYFAAFDCTKIIGNLDFCVLPPQSNQQAQLSETGSLLWAEAKKGESDVYASVTQLALTIGKARLFDVHLPPPFLGAFDAVRIVFIPYSELQEIFYLNDFNWNVAPSNHKTREFKLIYGKVKTCVESGFLSFAFGDDDDELKGFIKANFVAGKTENAKTRIDKNNFTVIYNKWSKSVKPTIAVNWETAKKHGIIDGDFYLADLLSAENETLKEKLHVLLKKNQYVMDREMDVMGMFTTRNAAFLDKQQAHRQFWNKYERPPREEYWDYMVERRDLLVPQDVRERKGSYFTPQAWVELSQKYLADALGENWQDEYYVWDCAAGTGNLLAGLTNTYNIWASTLDKQDVAVMQDRIKNGANLAEDRVFQFDFLNDSFEKLPEALRKIVEDPEKRKKLVVYINPPYAEATSYGLKSKAGVSSNNKIHEKYKGLIGKAINELFAQFFIRIHNEIPGCKLAAFSKVKYINSQNFIKFRSSFKAEYKTGFVCPSNSFDNVKGNFPIGFLIWDLFSSKEITKVETDVILNGNGLPINRFGEVKTFYAAEKGAFIIDWLRNYFDKKSEKIGYLRIQGTDIQQNRTIFVTSNPSESDFRESKVTEITQNNLIEMSIYYAARHVIRAGWLNDRDQFLYPDEGWQTDTEFQNDCLAYTLFTNNIQSKYGINHWVPFPVQEIKARDNFKSDFMARFIAGKIEEDQGTKLFKPETETRKTPLVFSSEAKAVFDAGRELWRYYHAQPKSDLNAALYDIKAYFQGRNEDGRMGSKSGDETYTEITKKLRENLKKLAKKIEGKIYEHGFLKR